MLTPCIFWVFSILNHHVHFIWYLLTWILDWFFNWKGNALKDVGKVDEAIQCYNVGWHFSFLSLWFASFVISNLFFLWASAMPFTKTKPPASTYQSWEYIYGMVYEIDSLIFYQIDIGYKVAGVYMKVLWSCRNMSAAAASCYKATLAVTTGLSAPFSNLAVIYKQQVMAAGLLSESISVISVPSAIEQRRHLYCSCFSLLALSWWKWISIVPWPFLLHSFF